MGTTTMILHLAVLFGVLLGPSRGALPLPSVIKPCSRNDPNLNECATANAMSIIPKLKNGIPGYGVPSLDPLLVKKIEVDENKLGVNLKFTDVNIHGLSKTKPKSIKITLDPTFFRWKLYTSELQLIGKYEASGRILVLPIVGKGDFNITLYGLDFTYDIACDKVKRSDGELYYVPKSNKIDYDVQNAHLHMDNLFNGNKLLGDEMNRFMNENWRDVNTSVGPKVAESIAIAMQVITKALTSKVPVNEFFPEKV